MTQITDMTHKQRTTYSHLLYRHGDASWEGVIVTPEGIVLVWSSVRLNQLHLTFVIDGIQYERWIKRTRTPKGAAVMANKFVKEVVNGHRDRP